jgi:tetratricopeptide (TPR) repeat protein
MNNIRTLNLIWEKQIRGAYPVSAYALANDGSVTLALPRPLQVRAYDLTRLHLDGSASICAGFAVETLQELETSSEAADALGMTADDVYLLCADRKSRFLGERRIYFVDTSLSQDGQCLAVAFSDLSGTHFALAYGAIDGRVLWSLDMDFVLSAVAISRDGQRIAVGAENGNLWLYDAGMRPLWEFGQPEPIRALACSADGMQIAYGTAGGAIGLIDGMGSRRWETRLSGDVVRVALAGDGGLCAALAQEPSGSGVRLICLTEAGQVRWDYLSEKRLCGLALSAQGNYLATGARDGTCQVFEVVLGETGTAHTQTSPDNQAQAAALENSGDLTGAFRLTRAALDAEPANLSLCESLIALRARWQAEGDAALQRRMQAEDYASVIQTADALLAVEANPTWLALQQEAQSRHADLLLLQAKAQQASGELEAAENALREAIALAPYRREIRQSLGALQRERAAAADAQADALLAQGDLENGLAALERAQAILPTPEREAKCARVHTAMEFAFGMAHYHAKRYPQAVFQFKKTLARDPGHAEAKRYLGYAQRFLTDASASSIADRFAHLENT